MIDLNHAKNCDMPLHKHQHSTKKPLPYYLEGKLRVDPKNLEIYGKTLPWLHILLDSKEQKVIKISDRNERRFHLLKPSLISHGIASGVQYIKAEETERKCIYQQVWST